MITIRAALAVALLRGYWYGRYLVSGSLAAVSVWLWLTDPGLSAALLSAVTVLSVTLSVRASRVVRHLTTPTPSGTVLPPRADSALWTEVRELCEQLGVAVPDELRIGAEPRVESCRTPRRLGLAPGSHSLYVGLPLLFGMTPAQLRALLSREVADPRQLSRAAATCQRARGVLGPALVARPRTAGVVFAVWARLFLAVEAPVSRQLEFVADRAAVALAGRAGAAGALRELPVLATAWRRYVDDVIAPAARAGYAPLSLSDGFAHVRLAWGEELERLRTAPEQEPRRPWQALANRVERLHAIDLAPEPAPGSALVPLRPRQCAVVREVERDVIGADVRRVSWDEFSATAASQPLRDEVAELFEVASALAAGRPAVAGAEPGLDTVLRLIEAGALPELERRLRPPVRGLLAVAFAVAAVDAGVARWRTNPAGGLRVVRADGGQIPVEELAARVVADPSTVPMVREVLRTVRAARADQLV